MRRTRHYGVTLALTATMATVGVTTTAARAETFSCKDKLHKKDAIPFRPFPLENPATGEAYAPTELITLRDGRQVRAMDFFREINEYEQKLNSWGYSLRDAGVNTLEELDTCVELLKAQKDTIEKDLDKNPPKLLDVQARVQAVADRVNAYKENVVALAELWEKADATSVQVNLPEPPPFTAPVPTAARVEPKDVFKKRSWAFDVGRKELFWIAGEANVGLQASRELTKLSADGRFLAALMGVWDGEVASAEAVAEVGKNVDPTLRLGVRLVGKTVWAPMYPRDGDNAAAAVNKALHKTDTFSLSVDESATWRFAIGPIPMAARVGFRGAAGLGYGYDVAPTAVGGFAGPFAKADAYAQIGADIGIAGAGIEGSVVLVDDQLTLRGDAMVDFVDEPKLTLGLSAKNTIEALSGKLSAYAYVDYLFGTWRGEKEIFRWEGLRNEWDIFHFTYIWTPTGVRAEGDVKAEDVMEITEQNQQIRLAQIENQSKTRLYEVMRAVSEDLATPAATQVIVDRTRIVTVAEGVDANATTYLGVLRQWLGT